jgi:SAM domain (Sterile alpha motif)/PH domain
MSKSVEGPRGPHLFRSSTTSSELSFDQALQMSPLQVDLSTQVLSPHYEQYYSIDDALNAETPVTAITETYYSLPHPGKRWQSEDPKGWTTQQVCVWMEDSGIEAEIVDLFVENDIAGAVLIDLQFQDLKDLGIQSFGKRHQIWNHIAALKEQFDIFSPIEELEPEEKRTSNRSSHRRSNASKKSFESCDHIPETPPLGKRRRRRQRKNGYEPITPADSVSIVAIEQLIPKPHVCARGDKCEKTKHQKKLLKRIEQDYGFPITPQHGGRIFMVGNAGDAATAKTLIDNVRKVPTERSAHLASALRPVSEAEPSVVGPSVVASSDILGPGDMPDFTLDPEKLEQIEERDPQDNVKAFLALQDFEPPHEGLAPFDPDQPEDNYVHPETNAPPAPAPLAHLQSLPRLQIPKEVIPYHNATTPGATGYDDMFSPACRTALPTPTVGIHRFGTPASEMDVPVTQQDVGPVARETSQSVPPNMQFREPVQRTSMRPMDWRRPSQLPPLAEHAIYQPARPRAASASGSNSSSSGPPSPKSTLSDTTGPQDTARSSQTSISEVYDPRYANVTHAGWMKKRKTRLLRHEWHEHHFRLTDKAQLTMHKNDISESSPLESLNIDDYTVACSNLASNKLSAKLKALKIQSSNRDSAMASKDASFTFQLVPAKLEGEDGKLKKPIETKKTHHFAVKTRDQRIDWMRELMLAKALREREGKGYEVEVHRGEKESMDS